VAITGTVTVTGNTGSTIQTSAYLTIYSGPADPYATSKPLSSSIDVDAGQVQARSAAARRLTQS
jgi:hypothetical protein